MHGPEDGRRPHGGHGGRLRPRPLRGRGRRALSRDRADDEVDPAARDQRPPLARAAPGPHRRRRRGAPLLPLLARAGEGRRGSVLGVAHRLLGRARVRAVLLARGGGAALGRGRRRRREATGWPRSRRSGSSPGCSSSDATTSSTRRARTTSASTSSSGSTRPSFTAGACRRGRESAQPVRHPRRGRTGSRLRRRRDEER